MPMLDPANIVGLVWRHAAAGPDDMDRAVVEDSSPDSLIDVDRRDLVHVDLDRVPFNEAALENDAAVGHCDLGGPAHEPCVNERHTNQNGKHDGRNLYQDIAGSR